MSAGERAGGRACWWAGWRNKHSLFTGPVEPLHWVIKAGPAPVTFQCADGVVWIMWSVLYVSDVYFPEGRARRPCTSDSHLASLNLPPPPPRLWSRPEPPTAGASRDKHPRQYQAFNWSLVGDVDGEWLSGSSEDLIGFAFDSPDNFLRLAR
ncbi:hypothetical protein DPMN_045194 [Dreissena polymorpha]|uniref:Uncharacterized protein n=1 Tax=Dreissena polymorpha TaxID=45954 RepID=A0A9D4D3P4_DREPO|nr:hypothetical protein DPMN_045194 [Dreissena polymorpha]